MNGLLENVAIDFDPAIWQSAHSRDRQHGPWHSRHELTRDVQAALRSAGTGTKAGLRPRVKRKVPVRSDG